MTTEVVASPVVYRVAAVGLFGLVPVMDPFPGTVTAGFGIGLLVVSLKNSASAGLPSRVVRLLTVGLVVVTVVVGARRGEYSLPEPARWWPAVSIGAVAAGAALVLIGRRTFDRIAIGLSVLLLGTLSVGVLVEFGANGVGFDSYLSHEVAADAVAARENPYTDAVSIPSGSPTAEPGETIDGYSYPPIVLVAFVAADWVVGDPRWTAVVAIVTSVVLFGLAADRHVSAFGATAFVLLSAAPTVRSVVWAGWTEPLTIVLMVLALATWRRWIVSAVLLGLALATKQYMVLVVPLLLLIEARPWRRTFTAVGVAVTTLIPAVVLDAGAFWTTMVARPLGLDFRPDSRSLPGALAQLGLEVDIPPLVVLGAILLVCWGLSRRVDVARPDAVIAASAVVLATGFFLSLAFANYWWLVQWLAAASVFAFGAGPERPLAFIRPPGGA